MLSFLQVSKRFYDDCKECQHVAKANACSCRDCRECEMSGCTIVAGTADHPFCQEHKFLVFAWWRGIAACATSNLAEEEGFEPPSTFRR